MGSTPEGKFSYRVGMENTSAVTSLKDLKNEITQVSSAWKTQALELKQAGDKLGAAEAKFKGVSDALEKQKQVIERLKAQQSELKKAQGEVDRSTEAGKNAFSSYQDQITKTERQIASATSKLNSLSNQQEKAKNSVEYYKSGLADAQSELRKISSSSKAYIDRLEAEGKATEANKAKLSSLKSTYEQLNKIYDVQVKELERIENSAGKASDKYRIQKQRVDETATSLAQTKTKMSELDSEIRKANPSVFDKMKSKLAGVNKEGEKSQGIFKKVFSGAFLGNLASNAFSSVESGLKGIISNGIEVAKAGAKIQAQWTGLGKSAQETEQLISQMKELKANTNLTGESATQLQMTMNRATNGNTEEAMKLSRAVGVIGDNTKMTSEQMLGFSQAMARVMTGSKVTSSQWNRMSKQAPGLGAAMAKAAGVSESAFAQMIDSGKLSTKQFKQLLEKVGEDGGKAYSNFGKTQAGAMKQMQARWQDLQKQIAAPLFDTQNKAVQQLSKLMASPALQQGAKDLGKAIAQVAVWGTKILEYIGKHEKDISAMASDVVEIAVTLGKDLWKTFASVVSTIADAFGLTSKNAAKSKDPLKQIRGALDGLAKNKGAIKMIAKAIVAIAAIKGLTAVARGIYGVGSAIHDTYKWVKGLPGAVEKSISSLKQLGTATKDLLNGKTAGGAFQSLKSAGGFGGLSTAGKITTGIAGAGVALDAGSSIFQGLTKDIHNADKRSADIGKGIGAGIGGGIGLWFGGPAGAALGSAIGGQIGKWGGQGVNEFTKGWQAEGKKNKPKNFVQWLGFGAHKSFDFFANMAKKVGHHINTNMKGVADDIKKKKWGNIISDVFFGKDATNYLNKNMPKFKKAISKGSKDIQKSWSSFWKKVGKNTDKSWKSLQKSWSRGTQKLNKGWSNFTKKAKKGWDSYWKTVGNKAKSGWAKTKSLWNKGTTALHKGVTNFSKKASNAWKSYWNKVKAQHKSGANALKKTGSALTSSLKDYVKKFVTVSSENFKNFFNDVQKGSSDFSKHMKDNHNNLFKSMLQTAGDGLKSMASDWQSKWNEISSNAGKQWDNLKNSHNTTVSGIAKTTESVLNSIKNTWTSVWNSISNFFKDVWGTIKNSARSGVNGVIDIVNGMVGGINSAWKFFTGKNAFGSLHHVATGGQIEKKHGRLAVINDEKSENYRELVQRRDGSLEMYDERDKIIPVEPGDYIYNAGETKRLMEQAGLEHYASGGWVSGIINVASNAVSGFFTGIKDKFELAEKWLKNPAQALTNLVNSAISGLLHGNANFVKFGEDVVHKMVAGFQAKWKEMLKKVDDQIQNPPGSGVERWRSALEKALEMNGLPTTGAYVNAWLRQIQTESSGNPNAVGGTDGLADGHATGLLQTKPGTFRANAFPGHGNIFNGFDNMLAAIRYALRRYGSSMLAVIGHGHGYADGGIATTPSIFGEAGPEMAIPLSAMKSAKSYQLLGQTAAILAARDHPDTSMIADSASLSHISETLDTIANLLTMWATSEATIENTINLDGRQVASGISKYMRKDLATAVLNRRLNISELR
ncbi:tape measure domain protein [Lactobacillus jensenii 1153]|jgi:putative tape measure protein|uniref:tape measure protein n=1 Tax=Lactobacillus jensenii TaxID=109790 RepID=UPI0001A44E7E|nr:tape measure protein [Lactobacillus jensenii]EEQ24677.1 tape measure domain protein [Lactobacillus jensenii 269-3]EEQ68488.1 tape measure domain protein [Lactobacillus jensenii 1153]